MYDLIKSKVDQLKSDERNGALLSPIDFELIDLYENYSEKIRDLEEQIGYLKGDIITLKGKSLVFKQNKGEFSPDYCTHCKKEMRKWVSACIDERGDIISKSEQCQSMCVTVGCPEQGKVFNTIQNINNFKINIKKENS